MIVLMLIVSVIDSSSKIYSNMFLNNIIIFFMYIIYFFDNQFYILANDINDTTLYFQPMNSTLEIPLMEIENKTMNTYLKYSLIQPHSENNTNMISICCHSDSFSNGSECQNISEKINDKKFKLPQIYDEYLNLSKKNINSFQYHYGDPCRYGSFALDPKSPYFDVFYLLENGTVLIYHSNDNVANKLLNIKDYCVANVIGDNNELESVIAVCFIPDAEKSKNTTLIKTIGMAISALLLAVTFFIYVLLPELKSLHSSILISYVASLFFAYINLFALNFKDGAAVYDIHILCISLAFFMHFSFLASFFWLNVMCFDIWWTVWGLREFRRTAIQYDRKKFKIYSIYAWGLASFCTGICLIMHFYPQIPHHFIRPHIGEMSCWFERNVAVGVYFYGPMGLIIICNIIFFILTTIRLVQRKKETFDNVQSTDSSSLYKKRIQWFSLYLKLFIVTGINWLMEILSWLLDNKPEYICIVFDCINAYLGVIIFIIYVCNSKIKHLLMKRLNIKTLTTNQSDNSDESTNSIHNTPMIEFQLQN